MTNFYLHTMGCKSNQFESAVIDENLVQNGYTRVFNIEEADLYILNSCSVTHKSDNEALYLLRNAKHKNPYLVTVLTGCLAQIEKKKLLEKGYIDFVFGNDDKLHPEKFVTALNTKDGGIVSDIMGIKEFNRSSINDLAKTRAVVKIQDGCDNRCSYCIIPFARGRSRSADTEFVIEQINNLAKQGFKEVVFTGIHIGQWGNDKGLTILDLLKSVEKETQIPRYRLGSLNPSEINDEMLEFLAKSNKFCPHFHLSLQSACNKTLKSMNRFYKVEDYLELIEKINQTFELPFLGSDIITGFAGETDADFEVTKNNLQKSGLSQIHTFPYSQRCGTVGATMPNQISTDTRNKRATIIKEISAQKYNNFVNQNLGKTLEVLIEKNPDKQSGFLKGLTRNYLTVYLDSKNLALKNTLRQVKLLTYDNGKIYGELI